MENAGRPSETSRKAQPRVGVIHNRRSHRNRSAAGANGERTGVFSAHPESLEALPEALEEFRRKNIDLLVINGGDGTVRDVLTRGQPVFGDAWPDVAVLPKGKTNALNADLGVPAEWTLEGAMAAYEAGRRVIRHPLAIEPVDGDGTLIQGFILGAGAFAVGIDAGQDAHRLGAFNNLAVGVATAWGVFQTIFGGERNPWRRGVGARIVLERDGKRFDLPHSGHGDPLSRGLVLASTLEGFPMGSKPFGSEPGPIRIGVLDLMSRRLVAVLPIIAMGRETAWMRRAGLHRASADAMEIDLDGPFILDGEAFPAGRYSVRPGPEIRFVVP